MESRPGLCAPSHAAGTDLPWPHLGLSADVSPAGGGGTALAVLSRRAPAERDDTHGGTSFLISPVRLVDGNSLPAHRSGDGPLSVAVDQASGGLPTCAC